MRKMLSAMTTSENFPLIGRSRCSPSPTYNPVIQPTTYVATFLRQNFHVMSANEGNLLKYRLIKEPENEGGTNKISSPVSCYLGESGYANGDVVVSDRLHGAGDERDEANGDGKLELESDLSHLLDQLELDDSLYEESKPLKIDPSLLKLDFGTISLSGDLAKLEKLYAETKRASHHLSGGSLVTDASSQGEANAKLCSGGGLLDTGNALHSFTGISGPANQISPSTPLTFDLNSRSDGVMRGSSESSSSESENSTNPFRNSRDSFAAETEAPGRKETANSFSPTNPFSDFCASSSPAGNGPIEPSPPLPLPLYENVLIPQKSFSQCSTRPASPVLKIPDNSSPTNPFLINETSPETLYSSTPQFFSSAMAANSASFIFAVPVFPFLQPNSITNSSTQTVDSVSEEEEGKDAGKRLGAAKGCPTESKPFPSHRCSGPVYQNLTNHLEKYMRRNNEHSEYDLRCLKRTVKDLRTCGWYYENVSWQESVILLRDSEPGTFLIRDSSDPNFLFSLSVQTSRGPTSVRLHYVRGQFRLDAEEKLIPHMPSFGSVIELIDYYVEKTVKNKFPGRHKKSSFLSSSFSSSSSSSSSASSSSSSSSSSSVASTCSVSIQKSKNQVWIDSQGNVYSNILLVKPLRRQDHFSSLQHLARLTINSHVRKRSNAKVKLNFKVTPVYESSPFQDDDSSFRSSSFDTFCPIISADTLPIPPRLVEYLQDYPYCH